MSKLTMPVAILCSALVLAGAIVAAAVLPRVIPGPDRFTAHASGKSIYRLDRETGEIMSCVLDMRDVVAQGR